MPEQQQRQKAVIELTSGKPSFDVVHLSYHVQKRQFEKGGWLADLSPLHEGPEPHRADAGRERFLARPACSTPRTPKGEMRSLPFSVDYWILYYNKELFAKKGVAYPEDLRRDGRRPPRR